MMISNSREITKVIHYCWFGGNPLPNDAIECIASWKKYLPGYEIKEWNESNFDLNCCDYVREAYEAKKWAFVSDYARFWILYNYGGLYFDTDVEIIKPIDDLIDKGPFMGCEPWDTKSDSNCYEEVGCNPGLGLAAISGLGLYKEILENYQTTHFILPDSGEPETVVERITKILCLHGYKQVNEVQNVCQVTVYPSDFFCPLNYGTGVLTITDNTRSIHHYTASWLNDTGKRIVKIQQKYAAKGMPGCFQEKVETLPLRVKNKVDKLGLAGTINFAIKKLLRKA